MPKEVKIEHYSDVVYIWVSDEDGNFGRGYYVYDHEDPSLGAETIAAVLRENFFVKVDVKESC